MEKIIVVISLAIVVILFLKGFKFLKEVNKELHKIKSESTVTGILCSKEKTPLGSDSIGNLLTDSVSRIEIIGSEGRELVIRGSYKFQIQDDGRTLKIFKII